MEASNADSATFREHADSINGCLPFENDTYSNRFSSPISIAHFSTQKKHDTPSPNAFVELTSSFKKVDANDQEEDSNAYLVDDPTGYMLDHSAYMPDPHAYVADPNTYITDPRAYLADPNAYTGDPNACMLDMMGNKIENFCYQEPEQRELSPILEDKQNQIPSPYSRTPLKVNGNDLRSPLQDITPSMTQRKKKAVLLTISEKNHFLTPRTMEKSRFNSSSGLRRIERF